MTIHGLGSWPAQQPPTDFADQTVLAILAAEARPVRRRTRRRWPALLSLAAIFLGAGAWAAMGGWRPDPPVPTVEPALPVPSVPPPATSEPVKLAPPPAPEPEDAGAPRVRARPKPSATAAAAPPVVEPPDAGGWTILPSCTCSPFEGICSCVE